MKKELLLDEIFAVGDEGFRNKAFQKLEEFKKHGVTIILCSHYDFNLSMVDKKITLEKNL